MIIEELKNFNKDFDEVMNIYYTWWGLEKGVSIDEIIDDYKSNLFKDTLPKVYVLKDKDTIIGTYELNKKDGVHNEEYEPYLANVFIKEEYRGNGYSKLLIESSKEETKKLGYDALYLHTRHINYYEKFGFNYIKTSETKYGPKRIFKCELKK